jgi:calcium/calmodulin-dependent 3',5'-cyclic nucleotide phosphodiesterase
LRFVIKATFFVISGDSGLTIVRRLSGKKSQQQQSEFTDNQLEQYIYSDSQPATVTSGFHSFIENRLAMQPTSLNDKLENIDLTTENLPAVDTPDACDKAAVR